MEKVEVKEVVYQPETVSNDGLLYYRQRNNSFTRNIKIFRVSFLLEKRKARSHVDLAFFCFHLLIWHIKKEKTYIHISFTTIYQPT